MKTYKHGLQKLLNDDLFWTQFTNYTLSTNRLYRFREYRTNGKTPSKVSIRKFIEEDYKPITKDSRPTNEIALELVSPIPE